MLGYLDNEMILIEKRKMILFFFQDSWVCLETGGSIEPTRLMCYIETSKKRPHFVAARVEST
jgi:hypothetical protein